MRSLALFGAACVLAGCATFREDHFFQSTTKITNRATNRYQSQS